MLKVKMGIVSLFLLVGVLRLAVAAPGEDHFFVQKMSFEDRVRVLESMTDTCDIKPTAEILKEILFFEHEVHRDTKCFLRCLVEWFDLHVEDAHHVDVEAIMAFASALFPENIEHIRMFLHECNLEIKDIPDKCDAAYAHLVCMHKKLTTNGIDIPNFEQ